MQDKPVALVTGANKGNRSSNREGSRGPSLHHARRVAQPRARGDGHEECRRGCPRALQLRPHESGLHRSRSRAHPEHAGGTHRQRIEERRIAHMELERDDPHPILKDQAVMIGRPSQSLVVATPTALLTGEGVRNVLLHSLGYWNDSAQKSAGDGNGCS
jgi:hypothetical protein